MGLGLSGSRALRISQQVVTTAYSQFQLSCCHMLRLLPVTKSIVTSSKSWGSLPYPGGVNADTGVSKSMFRVN